MASIEDKLQVLNQQELAKVFKLIDKLAAKHGQQTNEEEIEEIVEQAETALPAASPTHIINPNRRAATPYVVPQREVEKVTRRGQEPAEEDTRIPDRVEPFYIPRKGEVRPNLFLDIVKDIKVLDDEKNPAWNKIDDKKVAPVQKGTRRSNLVKIPCQKCNQVYEVNAIEIQRDPTGGPGRWTCNRCVVRLKG